MFLFGIPMKLVRLIIMCLNETCSIVQVGKYLTCFFYKEWFETRRYFFAIAFHLCFRYAIRMIQVNQDDLKLNGTHQLLVYVDGINVVGGSVQNKGTLVVASKEIGLGVNADKTKNMDMSRDQNVE